MVSLNTLSMRKNHEIIEVDNIHFAAAHRIPNHPGKCSKLHGHNYSVSVAIEYDPRLNFKSKGYFIDFGVLKANIKYFVDTNFDHKTILHINDKTLGDHIVSMNKDTRSVYYTDKPPTAETLVDLIANSVYEHTLFPVLKETNMNNVDPYLIAIVVKVRESASCTAIGHFYLGEWI